MVNRYLKKPSHAHINAVKRIFKYTKGTANLSILYKSDDVFDFVGYSDAGYAGDIAISRSTSGYMLHICSGVISWASLKQ